MADPILGKRTLDKYISHREWDNNKLKEDQKIFKRWARSLDGEWANTKETELTSNFYDQILVQVLGYKEGPDHRYTMAIENRTKTSAQRPDVVLGNFTETDHDQPRALIEFESPYTPLDSHGKGVEQAFSYQSQYKKPVRWIIASNFRYTRIYDRTREHVEEFSIKKLAASKSEIQKFIFFLGADSIIHFNSDSKSELEEAIENNVANQEKISDKFYDDYLLTREKLISNIVTNNSQVSTQSAFTYAQKILDRFIFIAFAQDYDLIPPRTFESVINVQGSTFNRFPIWTQMKELFHAIDKGWPEKHINHFNGGLFKPDPELDELGVSDDIFKYFKIIDDYDFKTDLSVNLLGHIFEQAVNDIDAAKSGSTDSAKRKHDGIFYTPASITGYLLNETLQSWLGDAYRELGIDKEPSFTEKDYDDYRKYYIWSSSNRKKPNKHAKAVSQYVAKLEQLEDRIRNIKIIDPAVGSGSFLNQSLESLKALLNQIKNTIEGITLQQTIPTLDTDILSKNLFGVDINKESVEIAKLSLWLRTANKNKPLTTLDNNLKVGNSVVDDPEIVDDAFIWGQEFDSIFKVNRGFDIVLGNPPYVTSIERMTNAEKNFYKDRYSMSQYQENLYRVFTEKGFNLLKPGGWFGFIVPKTWFNNIYFGKMREFLRSKTSHLKIIDIKDRIFEDANVDTSLIIFKKPLSNTLPSTSMTIGQWKNNQITFEQRQEFEKDLQSPIVINQSDKTLDDITNKISKNSISNIGNELNVTAGIELFERGKGTPPQPEDKEIFKKFKENNDFFSEYPKDKSYYPYYEGNQLHRYHLDKSNRYLRYGKHLAARRKFSNFEGEHILIRRIPIKGKYVATATLVGTGVHLHEQAIWDCQPKKDGQNLKFLLGVINSSLTSYWLIMKLGVLSRDTFPQLRSTAIKSIPIPKVSERNQQLIANKVNQLIEVENRRAEIINQYDKTLLLYSSKNIPSFSSILESNKSLIEWIKKNVPTRKVVAIVDLIDELKTDYNITNGQISNVSREIDNQLYSAFKLTDREKTRLEQVLDSIH